MGNAATCGYSVGACNMIPAPGKLEPTPDCKTGALRGEKQFLDGGVVWTDAWV
jgi:hypothetical protein